MTLSLTEVAVIVGALFTPGVPALWWLFSAIQSARDAASKQVADLRRDTDATMVRRDAERRAELGEIYGHINRLRDDSVPRRDLDVVIDRLDKTWREFREEIRGDMKEIRAALGHKSGGG